jgi:predicted MPP superfamily phosphohydrolase
MAGFYMVGGLGMAAHFVYARLFAPSGPARQGLISPERRRFLQNTALAAGVTPFAACAYGILYERTEIETTLQRINLARLPKGFDGFRIAQLSDLHIGPFMTGDDIRRCVDKVNQMKPDLVALTGDFVTWDATTQTAAVAALRGLKAPMGIWGCLGNHEMWSETEDSITRLFAAEGVRILRHENGIIESGGERLNLIGVDYQTRTRFGPPSRGVVRNYLQGVDALMLPDTVNLLLSHNPNTFDRAAELGIDLSLAGHTHGGQVTLEFISPKLSPSRLITAYVRGWFQKGQSQLYVNRGIGTIGFPMRIGSSPEITLYELKRG